MKGLIMDDSSLAVIARASSRLRNHDDELFSRRSMKTITRANKTKMKNARIRNETFCLVWVDVTSRELRIANDNAAARTTPMERRIRGDGLISRERIICATPIHPSTIRTRIVMDAIRVRMVNALSMGV